MKIDAVILAAGRGTRAGDGIPKTYRDYRGKPTLRWAVDAFYAHAAIRSVQLVIHPNDRSLYDLALSGLDLPSPVFGGATRALSVLAGMRALDVPDAVLIHDGARPNLSGQIIDNVIAALAQHDGAIPALPVVDAMWSTNGGQLVQTIPRDGLVRAQTPQGFRYTPYLRALTGNPDGVDDAQIAVAAGMDIIWVEGNADNIKLTYHEDFL